MKKLSIISLVVVMVLGLLLASTGPILAANTINFNNVDDSTIISNTSNNSRTSININQSSYINSNTSIYANTGGNSIIAGGDIKGGSITTGAVNISSNTNISANVVDINVDGGSGASSQNSQSGSAGCSNQVSGNNMDDSTLIANCESTDKTEVNLNQNAHVNTDQTIVANTGNNSVICGDDCENVSIATGDININSNTGLLVNSAEVNLDEGAGGASASNASGSGNEANNNSADDSTIIQNSETTDKTEVNSNQNAFVNIDQTTVANTGDNTVVCGEDCENVGMLTGEVDLETNLGLDVNSTVVTLEGDSQAGSASSGSNSNQSNNNNFDDSTVIQNEEVTNKEEINNNANIFFRASDITIANSGGNTFVAGDDINGAFLFTGRTKIKKSFFAFFNWFEVRRIR